MTFALAVGTSQAFANTNNIVVLGDSLSAAYGIQVEQGWVKLLNDKLKDSYQVINASISGETTDGGLRSLPALLSKFKPTLVIIELGANDGLRGFPPPVIEKNLRALITQSKQQNAEVLLLGMHIPPNYGTAYANAFHTIYEKLADEYNTGLVPFMLEGVATNPDFMQDDGLHPKANAQQTILHTIWPHLSALLRNTVTSTAKEK
jgi:acyl-CoA thioesterase-1